VVTANDTTFIGQWPPTWTRASLELTVLALVCRRGPTHGYDVARRLQVAGLGEIKGGSLYPVLSRLEDQRLVTSHWTPGTSGPGRKVVVATEAGHRALAARADEWREWTHRVAALVSDRDEGSTT
jgi:PadR family transcriptional regulator, regulatory protein PadR